MKRNKKILITAFCLLAILLTGGGIGLHYYKTMHYVSAVLSNELGMEITGNLDRPECGWYQLYGYYLRPGTALSANELYIKEIDDNGYTYRMSLIEFNLAEYKSQDLDESALNNIRQVFDKFSNTKSAVIVRFLYDWDGLGLEKEPDDINIILQHMKQAGAVLNEYEDLIYTTQGIFVGSWAEMHSSKYLSTEEMTKLLVYYASVTSPSIYLAVRTPNHYRAILQEMQEHPERYTQYGVSIDNIKARLGLYNDGMLGSISDTGTYQNTPETASRSAEDLRADELAFQRKLCINVPNGGEAVVDNTYNDWKNAIADLKTMHVSYLNQLHDEAVITKWKNSTFRQEGSIYDGMSAYDYITDHMGARLVLRDCTLSYTPYQKGPATGSIILENTGFSNLYHKKHFTLSLTHQETGKTITLLDSEQKSENIDPCSWNSQEGITIPFTFMPSELDDGHYMLTASLKDPDRGEIVPFANDGYVEALQGYRIGTITIER